jgi:uncharacterized RDD family membrane protein YckC
MMKKLLGIVCFLLALIVTLGLYSIKHQNTQSDYRQLSAFTDPILPLMLIVVGIAAFRKQKKSDGTPRFVDVPRRAASMAIDFILVIYPFVYIQKWLLGLGFWPYYLFTVSFASLLVGINICFLVLFGGTPGKLILGIRIVKDSFERITIKEVLLRTSVDIILTILGTIGLGIVYSNIDFTQFQEMSSKARTAFLSSRYPFWLSILFAFNQYWSWSEVVVMSFNSRRKAIHDYIAGTVVIYKPIPYNRVRNSLYEKIGANENINNLIESNNNTNSQ